MILIRDISAGYNSSASIHTTSHTMIGSSSARSQGLELGSRTRPILPIALPHGAPRAFVLSSTA